MDILLRILKVVWKVAYYVGKLVSVIEELLVIMFDVEGREIFKGLEIDKYRVYRKEGKREGGRLDRRE